MFTVVEVENIDKTTKNRILLLSFRVDIRKAFDIFIANFLFARNSLIWLTRAIPGEGVRVYIDGYISIDIH